MDFLKLYVHCSVCGVGGYAGLNSLTGDYSKVKHDDPEVCKKILAEKRERNKNLVENKQVPDPI